MGSNPTERSATVSDFRSLQTLLFDQERQLRELDKRVMNPLSPKSFCDLHGCNNRVWESLVIRRLGVSEIVGSNPTALTVSFHRVDQPGMVASLGSRRTQVQILPR